MIPKSLGHPWYERQFAVVSQKGKSYQRCLEMDPHPEEWNHWVVRHFCVYLLKKWQHHSLIRYFLFLFLQFQLITLFDCTGSLLRRGNSWLRMWFPDRDQTRAPALGGRSLNLWTTREVLILFLISLRLLFPLTA